MINIGDLKLVDLLPPSISSDPTVKAAAQALDNELKAVTHAVQEGLFLSRIDVLSEAVLDLLAWQFHVDFYESTLPVETKRQLVKQAIPWHRRKGTPAAVEELVTAVFGDGVVQEWFEYGGQPYNFKVITYNLAVTQQQANEFTRAVNAVKNTRSWLAGVEVTVNESMDLYLAGVVYQGDNLEIRQVV